MKTNNALKRIYKYPLIILVLISACGFKPYNPFPTARHPGSARITTVSSTGTNIRSIEAEGNLEVTHKLQCMSLESASPKYTPADLHGAILDCIKKKEYKNALDLFMIAGAYTKFDSLRVTDKTAHQAGIAIGMKTAAALNDAEKKEWTTYMKSHIEQPPSTSLCQNIKRIGAPEYYPRHMIQHGMQAILGNNENSLVENFNAEDGWTKSLETYLHCTF